MFLGPDQPLKSPRLLPLICLGRKQLPALFAGRELGPSEGLANHPANGLDEAALIGVFPFVEAEGLFVEVAEEVEGFDGNVSSLDAPLQQAPEVFEAVRVNFALGVALGMVNKLVAIVASKSELLVGRGCIGVHIRALQNVLFDVVEKFGAKGRLGNLQHDLGMGHSVTLQQALDRRHMKTARLAVNASPALAGVHVPGFAADVCFIYFDFPADFNDCAVLHGETDTLEHEPTRALRNANRAAKLVGANPVLRVGEKPESADPLFEGNRAVFQNRSDAERELLFRFALAARPKLAG